LSHYVASLSTVVSVSVTVRVLFVVCRHMLCCKSYCTCIH